MSEVRTVGATVTYGDRAEMCLKVLDGMVENGVSEIVVVANGSAPQSVKTLREWAAQAPLHVRIIENKENLGSAPGFTAALRAAVPSADLVWLLDDDNLPAPDALREAKAALEEISRTGQAVISCFRETDEGHVALLGEASAADVYPSPGSFFGVDIIARIRRRRRSAGIELLEHESASVLVDVPEAPYGGLLLPVEVVRDHGLPNERMVLYFDDVDYTRRLARSGVRLMLCTAARIDDLGAKWVTRDESGGYLKALIATGDRFRSYYSYRNSTYVEWRSIQGFTRVRFALNLTAYFAYVLWCSRRRPWLVPVFIRAVRDGFRGQLGAYAKVHL